MKVLYYFKGAVYFIFTFFTRLIKLNYGLCVICKTINKLYCWTDSFISHLLGWQISVELDYWQMTRFSSSADLKLECEKCWSRKNTRAIIWILSDWGQASFRTQRIWSGKLPERVCGFNQNFRLPWMIFQNPTQRMMVVSTQHNYSPAAKHSSWFDRAHATLGRCRLKSVQ